MKHIKKVEIKFIAIAAIIITALTIGVVNAANTDITTMESKGKNAIGNIYSLGYNNIANKMNTYCIQRHKTLKSATKTFVVDKYVEIDGKTATVYNSENSSGKEVKSGYNAIVAYIFNQKQGYGTVNNNTQGQKALWYFANEWADALFGDKNDYSWSGNDGISISNNSVAKEAKSYAASIGSTTSKSDGKEIQMTDQTPNKNNMKKKDLGNGYYRVGPFIWEFEGTLQSITVKADGNNVTDVKFVKYEGSTAKTVDVKNIESGDKFYIDIKGARDITSVHLDLKTVQKTKVEKVKVWFLKSGTEYQNLVHVLPSEKSVEAKGEGHQDYGVKKDSIKFGLQKVDDRGEKTPLDNVGFKFRAQVLTYDLVDVKSYPTPIGTYTYYYYEWRPHTMYIDYSNRWSNISQGSAKEFKTNENGIIQETSVSFGGKYVIYVTGPYIISYPTYVSDRYANDPQITAIESSNPHYGYSPEIGKEYPVNSLNETKLLYNHQKYVKLSGYVWLEENQGKTTVRNNLYDKGVEEGLNGIKVYLKDANGNIVRNNKGELLIKETGEKGIYSEIDGGEYRFEGVDLDELQAGKYHIEFEYGGIKYQSVASNLSKTNGSKAIDTNSRNILDSKFTSVDGNGTQTLHISDRDVQAEYNGTNKDHVNTVNYYKNDEVYARTDEAGYHLYSDFEPTMEEIRYINLGLFEKEQTDYAITKDLYNVRVEVNGKSHIYRYATVRYNAEGEIDEESSWNVGVKFQRNTGTYARAIYKADGEFTTSNKDKELKVYTTYKIALKNESPYLGRINNIVDYCDNRMKLIHAGTSVNEQDVISNELHSEQMSYNSDKYSKYRIDTNAVIESGVTQFIYVQFEMNREAVLSLVNNGEVLNNTVEINSYTTFKDNNVNTPVAVVDKDSVPGNVVPGQVNTYEDDTDGATSLKLELKNARGVNGTVFVDTTGKEGKEAVAGEERKGNGIFDNGETTLGGILVTLKENSGSGKVYQTKTVDSDGKYGFKLQYDEKTGINYFEPVKYNESESSTYAYVADNLTKGNFLISNYIPGDYTLTYTWGDSTYKVQYYKGTIYNNNRVNKYNQTKDTFWYRGSEYNNDTISAQERYMDAFDKTETRATIDNEMRQITINTLETEINNAYKDGSSQIIKTTKMDSITPTMQISVEYPTTITDGTTEQVRFTIQNVDFGIVERAKQALDFTKKISGYKITLANGQVLVDAKIDENGNLTGTHKHTIYLKPSVTESGAINIGQLKTEMDNELIEGATLETTYTMKVTNVGEKDYSTKDYYYYGITDESKLVTASVTELLDYVDGRLSIVNQDDSNNKWTEIEKEYLEDVNASKKKAEDINKYRIYLTSSLTKDLKPGDSNSVTLSTSKLLTSTDDNTFNNESEIAKVRKNQTGFIGTPVKLINNYFNIGDSEQIIIIPSTGDDKDYILPIVIGITAITILGVGIILIKRFIVDKK